MYNNNEYTPGEKYLKEYIVNNGNGEHCVRIPDAFEALKIERKCLIEHICKWLEENTCDVSDTDDINHNMYMISSDVLTKEEFIESFKQAMLEE